MNVNFYLHYVEDSSPKIKKFKTAKKAEAFKAKFEKDNQGSDGYWIDFLLQGDFIWADQHYKDFL